jgi:DNA replication licensing factor MCM3
MLLKCRLIFHLPGGEKEILTVEFLKRYLKFANVKKPQLSKKACQSIGVHYAVLRQKMATDTSSQGQLAVTTRTLEAMIRLATAHAKLR